MLSHSGAAHTQLHLRIKSHQGSPEQATNPGSAAAAGKPGHWLTPLAGALRERVERLEMPTLDVGSSVAAACRAFPRLRTLMLECSSLTRMGSLLAAQSSPQAAEQTPPPTWLANTQLHTLSLWVPPGMPPFVLHSPDQEHGLLDLSALHTLEHLRLKGPIVKDMGNVVPFALRLNTKVRTYKFRPELWGMVNSYTHFKQAQNTRSAPFGSRAADV